MLTGIQTNYDYGDEDNDMDNYKDNYDGVDDDDDDHNSDRYKFCITKSINILHCYWQQFSTNWFLGGSGIWIMFETQSKFKLSSKGIWFVLGVSLLETWSTSA